MLALYELIKLLPSSFVPKFSGQLEELFHLIKKEELTEEEAAQKLFKSDQRGKYFNKLKHKLIRELTNNILVMPSVWTNTKQKELCDACYKGFATYKILLASGSRIAAIEMAKNLLPKAKYLELYDMVYSIATDLEYHFSALKTSPGNTKKYAMIADSYLKKINSERVVRSYLSKVALIYNRKHSFTPALIKFFEEAAKETLPLITTQSDKLNRLIYNIIVLRYQVVHDYSNYLYYCDEALVSFSKDHPNYTAFKFAFLQKKIPALIALEKLTEAKQIAKEAGQMMPSGNYNWHLILLQRIEVCFHGGEFQEAYELYKAHTKYKCTSKVLIQYWNIIKAYLYFFINSGRIEPYSTERFNLGKFLNEIPIYTRDKAGVNINIILIQILIQMQREQYGRIIDRIEALNAYAKKHTKYTETERANIFIKMIIKMEAASFHRKATERKTQSLVKRLTKTPLKMGQNLAVEIVPYSILWEEMLEMLDNKFRAIKLNKTTTLKPKDKKR